VNHSAKVHGTNQNATAFEIRHPRSSDMTQSVVANTEFIASKVLDGEAILINLQTGVYYSFNPVAGLIWSMASGSVTTEAASDLISKHFDVSTAAVMADVQSFLDELRAEGLARITERPIQTTIELPDLPTQKPAYSRPSFEKFTDMMEMFALDPPLPGLARKQD